MWKESATRASECTEYPTISSKKKKAVSIPSSIIMRVDLESPISAVRGASGALGTFVETEAVDKGFGARSY
jgi:hypothetical protein